MLCLTLLVGCETKNEEKLKEETNKENNETNIKEEINDNGTLKEEINNNVIKEQVIDGITFSDVEIVTTTYSSTISIKMTNNTNNDITLEYVKIYFKDKEGNNILGEGIFAVGSFFGTIETNQTEVLNINVDANLSEVYNIDYEIVK